MYMQNVFVNSELFKDLDKLTFIIDERNVATESKYTLQEYLNTELNLTEHYCNDDMLSWILQKQGQNDMFL